MGLADEPVAVAKYVDLNNHSINIYPASIVISPVAYWIGASPDRKVYIPDRVPSVGILEVKCPRVSSVLEAKCLKHSPGQGLKLNKNDPYFTQIQTQLAVTGLEWCDFLYGAKMTIIWKWLISMPMSGKRLSSRQTCSFSIITCRFHISSSSFRHISVSAMEQRLFLQ